MLKAEQQEAITKQRREQIIYAAEELFDRNGFKNTTISEITKKAGISKGLFYHYFNSKKDVLMAMVEPMNNCLEEVKALPDPFDSIRMFSNRLLSYPYYEGYIPPIRVLFNAIFQKGVDIPEDQIPLGEDFGKQYFGDLFRKGQELGIVRSGDPEVFGDVFWKYLLGCLANMSLREIEGREYKPDVEPVLDMFRV